MFHAAQEDFRKASALNATFPYYAIWLYLARARAGQGGRAELAASVEKLKWVGITEQIVALFLGKTTSDEPFFGSQEFRSKEAKSNPL